MTDRRDEERAALQAQVAAAARIIGPAWPLEAFVAVNPLWGLVERPFPEAVATARAVLGIRGLPGAQPGRRLALTAGERCDARLGTAIAATADAETARWCAAFAGTGRWPMPGRERGLYAAWRELAGRGRALRRLWGEGAAERIAALPAAPEDAVLEHLLTLRARPAQRVDVLRGQLARLPGWAGHARWAEDNGAGLTLMDLLAVRMSYETELLRAAAGPGGLAALLDRLGEPERDVPALDAGALDDLEAAEARYADRLLAALDRPEPPRPSRPGAQAVFCIDVRSEGLRRRLEAEGDYETLGFAGFFAVAMRFRALGDTREDAQAPVLLDPAATVAEVAADPRRYLDGRRWLTGAEDGFGAAKSGAPSAFALAELGGWVAGPLAAAKTLAPPAQAGLRRRSRRAAAPPPEATVDVDAALTPAEQELLAHTALTMMGLTDGFGRLVLLCGHGSSTENNPYAAALDCGACGGHGGAPNARAAAAILNRPSVREGLAARGIEVPADTWFVAGLHDTTTDAVTVLDRHLVPAGHRDELDRLQRALDAAGAGNAARRARELPGRGDARTRAADWAQVRPEWGLARNAAFVAGPRTLTAGLDLEGRVFLHSYDWRTDPGGTALETILTAPLVVAHWINAQYYFSTTDPEVLGAGDKVVHNVVGGLGVLQGPDGDLRPGLPWQACFAEGRAYHEPLRLLAVVQAPLERIEALIARNAVLRHLFDGGWVHLAARSGPGEPWQRRDESAWRPWAGAAAEVAA